MRLLVISDTHGYLDAARSVARELGPWDQIIHLGDSALDAVALAAELRKDVVALRGNNEHPGSRQSRDVLVFEAGGVGFYALHGHDLDVSHWDGKLEADLAEIARRAEEARAQVALFGHTHVPLVRTISGVLLVNPGGMSMGDAKKTYAEITVEDGRVKAEIREWEKKA
ncbi:MAG TPA: metallophosphoesterase [bacterium]|nr:metallophosphoesterase [bacterium]